VVPSQVWTRPRFHSLTKIPTLIEGFGRSTILPRQTREHRLHVAETFRVEGKRHSWKFGGDVLLSWMYNFPRERIFLAPTIASIPSPPGNPPPSLTCPFPPCINPLARPIPQLGSINVFESASSSVYNGGTLSIRRHMTQRNLRSYTFAHAVDDGQDALVAGRPATVQNSYAPNSE
jgi:hypothetical protein